jgi:hypothetical protein
LQSRFTIIGSFFVKNQIILNQQGFVFIGHTLSSKCNFTGPGSALTVSQASLTVSFSKIDESSGTVNGGCVSTASKQTIWTHSVVSRSETSAAGIVQFHDAANTFDNSNFSSLCSVHVIFSSSHLLIEEQRRPHLDPILQLRPIRLNSRRSLRSASAGPPQHILDILKLYQQYRPECLLWPLMASSVLCTRRPLFSFAPFTKIMFRKCSPLTFLLQLSL